MYLQCVAMDLSSVLKAKKDCDLYCTVFHLIYIGVTATQIVNNILAFAENNIMHFAILV